MFKKPTPLKLDRHHGLCFNSKVTFAFASHLTASPVVSSEAGLIAREYVLVFAQGAQSLPLAILGVQRDTNVYVASNGQWLARYIPAHVRRYPFALGQGAAQKQEKEQSFTLMFDEDAPHFSGGNEALLDDQGRPTPFLEKIQSVLLSLEHDQRHTVQLVAQLEAAGLLITRTLAAQRKDNTRVGIDGVRVVDTDRLAKLTAGQLHTLHESGALALVHAHLISLSNLKNSQLVAEQDNDLAPLTKDGYLNFGSLH